jgi:hypothetical protein
MDIEHCVCLSCFSARTESHEQDGEKLSRVRASCGLQQRPAILPWRFEPGLGPRPIHIGPCPMAGGLKRRRIKWADAPFASAS